MRNSLIFEEAKQLKEIAKATLNEDFAGIVNETDIFTSYHYCIAASILAAFLYKFPRKEDFLEISNNFLSDFMVLELENIDKHSPLYANTIDLLGKSLEHKLKEMPLLEGKNRLEEREKSLSEILSMDLPGEMVLAEIGRAVFGGTYAFLFDKDVILSGSAFRSCLVLFSVYIGRAKNTGFESNAMNWINYFSDKYRYLNNLKLEENDDQLNTMVTELVECLQWIYW